jgi:hypothetical protein
MRLERQLRTPREHRLRHARACEILQVVALGVFPGDDHHVARRVQGGHPPGVERPIVHGRQRRCELAGRTLQAGPECALLLEWRRLGELRARQMFSDELDVLAEFALDDGERGLRFGAQPHQAVVRAHGPEQEDGRDDPGQQRLWHR